jgi:hypothetical protein
MSLPWSAITWQGLATVLALVLAAVSGIAAYKATQEAGAQGEDNKGWLTGGDSYPYLEPLAFPEGIKYLVKHAGGYPVYDVQVRLQDLDHGPRLPDGSVLPTEFFAAGTLTSNTDKFPVGGNNLTRENPPPDSTEVRRFLIELPARNGLVLQHVTLTALKGRWQTNSHPIRKNFADRGWVELHPANFREAQDQEPRRVN